MNANVVIVEQKLTPTQKVLYKEYKELNEEGLEYHKISVQYMLWHMGFYLAFIATLIFNLWLPAIFALIVAIYGLIQHYRYKGKAKDVVRKIMKIEVELFDEAIRAGAKAFQDKIHSEDLNDSPK